MNEETYVRSHDHCEVYVGVHDDGTVSHVYAWQDSTPDIPGVTWQPRRNNAFRYASDPNKAAEYVREHFNGP